MLRLPTEDLPSKEAVLAWIEESKQKVISQAGMEVTPLAVASVYHGLFYSHLFDSSDRRNADFLPFERIKAGARLPRKL